MSEQGEQEQEDIYAAWVAGGRAWRAAQDAWAHWLDTLVERKEHERMATPQRPAREVGGKWLYTLWIQEWHVFYDSVLWEDLDEEIREHYRHLWDMINEGFAARIR